MPWSSAVANLETRVTEIERRFGEVDHRYATQAANARMRACVLFSILVHAVVVFGFTFKMPVLPKPNELNQPLDVVLVNAKSEAEPKDADALAQYNLEGGGNTDEDRHAKSPLPVIPEEKRSTKVVAAPKPVEPVRKEPKQVMTQPRSETPVVVAPPQPEPQTKAPPAVSAVDLMQRSFEVARLEARINRNWDDYQKRPRRRFIGARTKEFRFARYIEDWRAKIERIGELNYPQVARDRQIYGSLIVTVSIKADGSLEKVEVNHSSGQKILDEAAIRIVKLAAPFAPFPADIRKDTDILGITRTWTFTRSDAFVTE